MSAPTKAEEIKVIASGAVAFCTALFGKTGTAVIIMSVIFALAMLADYFTGSALAKKNNAWDSSVARAGRWHKFGEIMEVGVASLCDLSLSALVGYAGINLGKTIIITPVVLLWYIFTELGSITENCAGLGAPVPEWLTRGLARLREKADDLAEKE